MVEVSYMKDNQYVTNVQVEIDYASVKPVGYNYESHNTKVRIHYTIDVEYKSWGINGISPYLPEQKLDLNLELLADDQEDYQDCSVEVQIIESKIESDDSFNLNSAICPKELQLTITEIKAVKDGNFVAKAKATLVF